MPRDTAPTPQPRFMTPTEAATYMRRDRITVYRMIQAGQLRAYRLGRRLLIDPGSAVGLRPTFLISSAIMLAGVAIAYGSPLRELRSLPSEPAGEQASAA